LKSKQILESELSEIKSKIQADLKKFTDTNQTLSSAFLESSDIKIKEIEKGISYQN